MGWKLEMYVAQLVECFPIVYKVLDSDSITSCVRRSGAHL